MSLDTTAVAGPCEDFRERERAAWRAQCDRERAKARGREGAAISTFSNTYHKVMATSGGQGQGGVGAVGDGRQVEGGQFGVAGAVVLVGDWSLVPSFTGWRGEDDSNLVSA